MNAFVGVKKDLLFSQLLDLIETLADEHSYYFLRWTHKVSGIIVKEKLPVEAEFKLMIEGQMFNHQCELRWKQKSTSNYEVLLLTITDNHDDFQSIGKDWRIEPNNNPKFPSNAYPAYGYERDETRFPKGFAYSEGLDVRLNEGNKKYPKLAQRYFIDNETSTVQFVALTVEVEP